MPRVVADLMVETLQSAGVRRIFGIAGDSLNGITEAIRKREGKVLPDGQPEIAWVSVRHEEAAAFAAGAEAHLTGQLAVCAGSSGPGNVHLINGLFDCHRSRVPVLAIAAQIPSLEMGSLYFQQTHPEAMFAECSVFCESVTHPDHIPRILEMAIQAALAKRGVAVVVIPGDIALKETTHQAPRIATQAWANRPLAVTPPADQLQTVAQRLNDSRKTTILAGAGCAGAHAELLALAERLKAPIVHALRGKEVVEVDNPYDVGMTGLLGFSSGYRAMMRCDTLLMLGTDFPYQQFYPEKATIIQVDVRGENIGRRTRVDLGMVGDVGSTGQALLPLLKEQSDRRHLDDSLAHYKSARKELEGLATGKPGQTPIHPQYVVDQLSRLATQDAIFSCDVGTPTIWAARYLQMNGHRRLLGSFNHGSMANALPQATGAQASHPGRQVWSLSGDGGLSMLLGELLTLKQHELPVKTIVFNNGAYSFVELEMKAAGVLHHGTELAPTNFAEIATSAGLLGIRVELPEQLIPALQQAIAHPGPVVIDVVVNRQELSLPPTIGLDQAVGFNLFMIKAVLSGQGNEVIDLVKSNLLR